MRIKELLCCTALCSCALHAQGQFNIKKHLPFWKDTVSAENFGVQISAPAIATGFSASVVNDFIKKTRMQFQMGMLYAGNDTARLVYNLFHGHGNASLHFLRPFVLQRSAGTSNYFMAGWYNRIGALLPGQSGSSDRFLGSVESGISLMGHISGEQDAIRLTGEYRLGSSYHNFQTLTEYVAPQRWFLAHLVQMKIESRNTVLSFSLPLGISKLNYKLPFFFGFSQLL